MNVFISQKDNFTGNFGHVLRSSAIFYYRTGENIKTTISFMNYWKQKRDLIISVVASLRDLSGKLLDRRELLFDNGEVINYSPVVEGSKEFEGSIEIEIFSSKNMVIPYAAIMAVYETKNGISMVHSYSRTYSQHEIEEGRTITDGEESCWTMRDSNDVKSFCVLHNGGKIQPSQDAILRVLGPLNEYRETQIKLPEIQPYGTLKISPADYIPGLVEWLDGGVANASLSFKVKDAFTRLLVGNEAVDGSDLQVTHSNFNYSIHKTDSLESKDEKGYMYIPGCNVKEKEVVVYPDSTPGIYEVDSKNYKEEFKTGEIVAFPVEDETLIFKKKDGLLPTRLVTGLIAPNVRGYIPAETSLGIITHLQPQKRLWWAICACDENHKTCIIIHDMPEIYGKEESLSVSIRLFSAHKNGYLEKNIENALSLDFNNGISLDAIFPEAKEFLNGDFGYLTVFSEYVGLTIYTLIENNSGSHTLEHGF